MMKIYFEFLFLFFLREKATATLRKENFSSGSINPQPPSDAVRIQKKIF